jgi:hypothetical protein
MKRNSRILHLLTTSFNSYKIIKPQWCLLSAIVLKAKVGSAFAARISQKPKARFIISCLCVFLYFASSARTHNQASHNILSLYLCVYSLKLRQKEAAPTENCWDAFATALTHLLFYTFRLHKTRSANCHK